MTKNIWRVYGRHFFSIFHFVDAVQKLGQSSLSPLYDSEVVPAMSNTLTDAFWLCFVSILWGSTNPLIRKGSKGIEDISRSGRIRQFLAEIFFLASNWKYMIPFLLNQCGSVVFYLTLASVDLSTAVPITNSLTVIITTLTGKLLGEGNINAGTFIGMALVICGVTICVMDKAAV